MRVVGGYLRGFCWLIAAWALAPTACGGRTLGDDDDSGVGGFDVGQGGLTGIGGRETSFGGVGKSFGGSAGGAIRPTKGGAPGMTAGGAFTAGGSKATGGQPFGGARATGGAIGRGGSANGGFAGEGGAAGFAGGGDAGAAGQGCTPDNGCVCPANTTFSVFVDPVHGSDDESSTIHPTGVMYPAACRFATLGKGLAKARFGGAVVALSEGATLDTPVTFRNETFPLVVRSGVKLTGTSPGGYVIAYDGLSKGVVLQDRTAFELMQIVSEGGSGSLIACDGLDVVSLSNIYAQGDATISQAAWLGCQAAATDLTASGGEFCLDTRGSDISVVNVNRGSFSNCLVGIQAGGNFIGQDLQLDGNTDGVSLEGPDANVTLTRTQISQSRRTGVAVVDGSLVLEDSEIRETSGAGLMVGAGTVELRASRIQDNGWVDPLSEVDSGVYLENTAGTVRIRESDIIGNAMDGVHVAQGSVLDRLEIDDSFLDSNARHGFFIAGAVTLGLRFRTTQLAENGGSGAVFSSGVALEAFSGNLLSGNADRQLVFNAAAPGGIWSLDSATGCARPNEITCYLGGQPGLYVDIRAGVVDAGYVRWQSAAPLLGRDYVGNVTVHDTCDKSAMCPAAPPQRD